MPSLAGQSSRAGAGRAAPETTGSPAGHHVGSDAGSLGLPLSCLFLAVELKAEVLAVDY